MSRRYVALQRMPACAMNKRDWRSNGAGKIISAEAWGTPPNLTLAHYPTMTDLLAAL